MFDSSGVKVPSTFREWLSVDSSTRDNDLAAGAVDAVEDGGISGVERDALAFHRHRDGLFQHERRAAVREREHVDLGVVVAGAEELAIGGEDTAGDGVIAEAADEVGGVDPGLALLPIGVELDEGGPARVARGLVRRAAVVGEGDVTEAAVQVDPGGGARENSEAIAPAVAQA